MTPRTGHEGVVDFFGVVAGMGLRDFQVLDLMGSERQVTAEVRIVTDTLADEEQHLWTFAGDGLVTRMRHYVDTAKHVAAMRSSAAA
ncbi:MAG: hypothetical protein NVS2B6_11240 [Thermoleophilaceae bacterium]